MNPLKKLCDQLGLNSASLAIQLKLPESTIALAIEYAPVGALGTFLGIVESLGVKMRIRASDELLKLWISVPAIDDLHPNNEWRKSVGLCVLPPDRGQLVAYVRFLRKRHKWTYGEIKTHMERNFIPTAEGLREWRGSTIGHICTGGKVSDASLPLGYSPAFATAFRAMVAKELLVRLFRFDPFAPVRYEVDGFEDDRVLRIEAHHPTPEFVPNWVIAQLHTLRWFSEFDWGIGDFCGKEEESAGSG